MRLWRKYAQTAAQQTMPISGLKKQNSKLRNSFIYDEQVYQQETQCDKINSIINGYKDNKGSQRRTKYFSLLLDDMDV